MVHLKRKSKDNPQRSVFCPCLPILWIHFPDVIAVPRTEKGYSVVTGRAKNNFLIERQQKQHNW